MPVAKAQTPSKGANEYVRFFQFYGCSLSPDGQQLRGDCPFPDCRKDSHFYANPATGLWDCKRCQRNGNTYTFAAELHRQWLDATTDADYETLAGLRNGIAPWAAKGFQLAFNSDLQEWMFPAHSSEGKLVNLYCWREIWNHDKERNEHPVMSGPTFKQSLLGLQYVRKDRNRPLWLCEGHWDFLAWYTLFANLDLLDSHDLIGVPGAGTFPKENLPLLDARDVRVLFDNDKGGADGVKSLMKKICKHGTLPGKFGVLKWPEGTEEGYDIRDLCTVYWEQPTKAYNSVCKWLKPTKVEVEQNLNESYDPDVQPRECTEFEELIDHYSKTLHVTDGIRDTLAVMLAINVSLKFGGPPLWTYIVGPPSSGKSTLAECVAGAHPYCFSLSKMTGVFSGFRASKDASLLPKFQDRTVIIKDFTTILSASQGEQERIFGELRDLYDGSASVHYRNKAAFDYRGVRFTILACTTDAIRAYNRTGLGERFLQVEIDSYWDDRGCLKRHAVGGADHIDRAISNILDNVCRVETSGTGQLRDYKCFTWGFLEHLHNRVESNPESVRHIAESIEQDRVFKDRITALSQWVAFARAQVDRDRDKQILYRPRVELGLRLASQLIKLAVALTVVFGLDAPDESVYRVVRKVALDTASSLNLEIMLAIAHSTQGKGLGSEQLATKLQLGSTNIRNRLDDLRQLGIVQSHGVNNSTGNRGRNLILWRLSPSLLKLAQTLGFC